MTEARHGSYVSHLEELRRRLIRVVAAVVVGAIVAFVFRMRMFDLIVGPYAQTMGDQPLAFFRPTEGFSLFMRLSLFGGIILASPVMIYQTWRFVSPALSKRERRAAVPVVAVLTLLFLAGVVLGYSVLEPALSFLLHFGGDSLMPIIGANDYVSFAVQIMLVFGVALGFPVFLYLAAVMGLVGWRTLAAARRVVIMVILVVSALATPGDVITMLALAVPLYALFEATILLIRLTVRR